MSFFRRKKKTPLEQRQRAEEIEVATAASEGHDLSSLEHRIPKLLTDLDTQKQENQQEMGDYYSLQRQIREEKNNLIRAKYGIPIPSGSSTEASLSLKEKYGLPSASENRMRADRERSDRESYDELLPSSTSLFNEQAERLRQKLKRESELEKKPRNVWKRFKSAFSSNSEETAETATFMPQPRRVTREVIPPDTGTTSLRRLRGEEWGCLIITGVVLLSCLWEVIVAFGVLLLVLLIVIPFYISAVNKFCQAVTAYIDEMIGFDAVVIYNRSSVYNHIITRRLIEEMEDKRKYRLWIPARDNTAPGGDQLDQEIVRIAGQCCCVIHLTGDKHASLSHTEQNLIPLLIRSCAPRFVSVLLHDNQQPAWLSRYPRVTNKTLQSFDLNLWKDIESEIESTRVLLRAVKRIWNIMRGAFYVGSAVMVYYSLKWTGRFLSWMFDIPY